jgi:hypothetical protein
MTNIHTLQITNSSFEYNSERLENGISALAGLVEILECTNDLKQNLSIVKAKNMSAILSCIMREMNRSDAINLRDYGHL